MRFKMRMTGDAPVKYQLVFGIRSRPHLSSSGQHCPEGRTLVKSLLGARERPFALSFVPIFQRRLIADIVCIESFWFCISSTLNQAIPCSCWFSDYHRIGTIAHFTFFSIGRSANVASTVCTASSSQLLTRALAMALTSAPTESARSLTI